MCTGLLVIYLFFFVSKINLKTFFHFIFSTQYGTVNLVPRRYQPTPRRATIMRH